MTTVRIPISRPFFGAEEREAILRPLETGWVVQGPYVQEFERKFAAFTGAPHAAAASSCTTALHLAVTALGLKPGDEVIVPAFTWVSTANVVEYMGATPIFCDIDLTTFNIDVARVEPLITDRTVGLIPVHLFGLPADMIPLLELAKSHGLWIIEDAACGLGASYHGRHVGTFGEMGCFSFHPRKSITTGEGGMVTSTDAGLDGLVRSLRDHGASRSDLARHAGAGGFLLAEYAHLGYNFRMTDMQGALGSVQMDRAEWILRERTARAELYDRRLAGLDWLVTPAVPDDCVHGYQSYVCLFRPETPTTGNVEALSEKRNAVMSRLETQGIATRQGTHAVVLQRYYAEKYRLDPGAFPSAWIADRLSLSLPLYAQMSDADQDEVCRALEAAARA